MRYQYVAKGLVVKADVSGFHISGYVGYRNKGSSVLYSPWFSDHLHTHCNNMGSSPGDVGEETEGL